MKTLNGKFGEAKVFTNNVDEVTITQVEGMLNESFIEGSKVRIMPDCHAGKGSVIGTTMTITDKVVPNLVGVDIGCGMLCTLIGKSSMGHSSLLKKEDIDFEKLDKVINELVPSGMNARSNPHAFSELIEYDKVIAPFNENRAKLSIGTLGGGNHFIELNEAINGEIYLVIHSGSRNLGKTVAEHYQKIAQNNMRANDKARQEIIDTLTKEGRQSEIQDALKELSKEVKTVNKDLAYISGVDMDNYFNDLKIAQKYAKLNRSAMTSVILEAMGWREKNQFDTIHNYVDLDNMILRKGAISARKGELAIIPMNMRDGSLIVVGKGNPDWNYSAPHGAGRILSRSKAFKTVDMGEFKDSMKDVWSNSVVESTRDESPFVYKPMDEIIENTKDTVIVAKIIKPIYNFKAK